MESVARSLLFVPGDRPERYAKAAASGAHEVVLDLEDAVAPDAKSRARDAVAAWLRDGHRATVRINGRQTPWFGADLDMLRAGGTKRHKELLAPFGLNAADPAFWSKGLGVISGFIDELEKMG